MGADLDWRNVAAFSRPGREYYPVTVLHENVRSDAIDGVNLVDLSKCQRLERKFVPIDDDPVLPEFDCLTGEADDALGAHDLQRLGSGT